MIIPDDGRARLAASESLNAVSLVVMPNMPVGLPYQGRGSGEGSHCKESV